MKKNNFIILVVITLILAACAQQTSINNPATVGEAVEIGRGMSLTILDVIRPANSILNEPSQPDSVWSIIKVRIQCNRPADMTCNFGPNDLDFADEYGITRNGEAVQYSTIEILDWITELSGGEIREGNVVLLTPKGDKRPSLLVYQTLYGSPSYFEIP